MEQLAHVKMLTLDDLPALKAMETGIEDDYIIRIYDRLVESDSQALFGLFQDGHLLSIAGYSLFGQNKFAMIGRLRSDLRFRHKGHATKLLQPVVDHLRTLDVSWMGANTHVENIPARRLLQRTGLVQGPVIHYLILQEPEKLTGHTPGPVWRKIDAISEKYALLDSLQTNALGMFPYECYYPIPYDQSLFTDDYIEESSFYVSPDEQRFVMLRNDTKKYDYSHVKYFWNDHYHQPGFFETILDHWHQNPDNVGCWIDFSNQGFKNIPELSAYHVQEPWILYEKWHR